MKKRLRELRTIRGESADQGVPKDYESALDAYDNPYRQKKDRYQTSLQFRFSSIETRPQQPEFPDVTIRQKLPTNGQINLDPIPAESEAVGAFANASSTSWKQHLNETASNRTFCF